MKIHSFNYFAVIILSLFLSNFALANGQRADDSSILDIDASGEVDAMTDGLLMMRSMFGFTDDVLVDGAVAENCTECDSAQIQEHISKVRSATISQLNSSGEPGPQGEKGEQGDTGPVVLWSCWPVGLLALLVLLVLLACWSCWFFTRGCINRESISYRDYSAG